MYLKSTDIGRLICESVASNQPASIKTASEKFSAEDAVKISAGLMKVASFPYKEQVYQSTQEMMKIAATCLDSMTQSLTATQARLAELEKTAAIRLVLDDMIANGFVNDDDIHEKIAELSKKSAHEIEVVREAIKLASRGSKGPNVFFEESNAPDPGEKRGMFDGVIASSD